MRNRAVARAWIAFATSTPAALWASWGMRPAFGWGALLPLACVPLSLAASWTPASMWRLVAAHLAALAGLFCYFWSPLGLALWYLIALPSLALTIIFGLAHPVLGGTVAKLCQLAIIVLALVLPLVAVPWLATRLFLSAEKDPGRIAVHVCLSVTVFWSIHGIFWARGGFG